MPPLDEGPTSPLAWAILIGLGLGLVWALIVYPNLRWVVAFIAVVSFVVARIDLLRLRRLAEMLRQIEPLPREDIPEFLAGQSKNRYLGALLQYRYLALAVLLNVPGNFVIGGGGGIALMAGISRLYSLPGILIAVAIAVAPVPLAVTIFGAQILSG